MLSIRDYTSMTELELIQLLLLFCMGIVFTSFGINRDTAVTYLLAGIIWVATGLVNFTFNPVGGLPVALSYIFIALGVICFLAAFKVIGESVLDQRAERFKVGLR